LEQRVAQIFVVSLFGSDLTVAGRDFLMRWQPGGVVLLGKNAGDPPAVTRLTNAYQQTITSAGGLPLLIAVDQEPGAISHLNTGFTEFPTPLLITAAGQPTLSYRVGQAIGEELYAVGVNWNLAPVADLETNPSNPIIRRRSFGSAPAMVAPQVAQFVRGTQAAGILATAKHFPGHGDSSGDSHLTLPVIQLSRERLETVELAPFRAAIQAGVEVVMVAHIWYPVLEPQPDLPASLSSNIITGLLRRDLGFNGLIITDALDMDAIDTAYSYPEAVLKAIEAGNDMVISAHIGLTAQTQAIEAVVKAVRMGKLAEDRINASVERILAVKARYGILDWKPLDIATAAGRVNTAEHTMLVETLFQAGVTVAFDKNSRLPLRPGQDILMIYPATRPAIQRACNSSTLILRWLGVSETPQPEEINWAASASANADTVVVFTQNAGDNPAQARLVNRLPPDKTIAVALWSPYDVTAFPGVAAYLTTYSPLPPGIPAACAVLTGQAPALGRLPIKLSPLKP
jgi:beta-N-acetylhexosaminidase